MAREPGRTDVLVDTGREYRPGHPVRVRVVHREHRIWVTDDGCAFHLAGGSPGWQPAAVRVSQEFDVNFSRGGTVSLPVVQVGPPESEVVRRIGDASRAFYQELLELP